MRAGSESRMSPVCSPGSGRADPARGSAFEGPGRAAGLDAAPAGSEDVADVAVLDDLGVVAEDVPGERVAARHAGGGEAHHPVVAGALGKCSIEDGDELIAVCDTVAVGGKAGVVAQGGQTDGL